MANSAQRVFDAFAHRTPDRTPLFEHFWEWQSIYWDAVGHTPGSDEAMYYDALADGIAWEELTEYRAKALYAVSRMFELDLIHMDMNSGRDGLPKVKKLGKGQWEKDGRRYAWNPVTARVELADATNLDSDQNSQSEELTREQIVKNTGQPPKFDPDTLRIINLIREWSKRDGLDWVMMGEVGCGTAVAQYPTWMLMWMMDEPETYWKWQQIQAARGMLKTRKVIEAGCQVVALGGDCSFDGGPMISPGQYREFILPTIRKQVDLIHSLGAKAVYTSDGNHWPIKQEYFFDSGIDGCKETDRAAGMTMQRLVEEGVKDRVTIIGNVDARHVLCRGTREQTRQETLQCLEWGRKTPGGHILGTSHSVHEGVKNENYYEMIAAYREYFGLGPFSHPSAPKVQTRA